MPSIVNSPAAPSHLSHSPSLAFQSLNSTPKTQYWVEDGGGAPGVVVLAGGVLVDVWEVCSTGDIVLDDPTFVVWSGVAEGLIFEGEGATVVVLWPETVSAKIAHVHHL